MLVYVSSWKSPTDMIISCILCPSGLCYLFVSLASPGALLVLFVVSMTRVYESATCLPDSSLDVMRSSWRRLNLLSPKFIPNEHNRVVLHCP